MTNSTRTYRLTESTRANDLFGDCSTTATETLTVEADGIRVDRHVTGSIEGERIDQRSTKLYPGVSLEAAHEYRLRNGYQLVA